MSRTFSRAVAAAAGIALAVAGFLASSIIGDGPHASASTGHKVFSAEQAGYAATGAQFRNVTGTVYLRNPARYASNLGGYGYSVQLWSASKVIVLGVSDATSGGNYSPGIAVFNADHSVACAESSCPGYSGQWAAGLNYPIGHTVTLSLFYDRSSGVVTATVRDITANTSSASTYDAGTGVSFSQARVGAETGIDLWTAAPYTAPSSATVLGRFSAVGLTTYSGHKSGLASWFSHSKIFQTGAGSAVQVSPSDLSGSGTKFSVSLQP